MTTIQLDIPDHIKTNASLTSWKHINILELFTMFWIDLDYVIQERKYAQDFLNDIKHRDFVVSNHF